MKESNALLAKKNVGNVDDADINIGASLRSALRLLQLANDDMEASGCTLATTEPSCQLTQDNVQLAIANLGAAKRNVELEIMEADEAAASAAASAAAQPDGAGSDPGNSAGAKVGLIIGTVVVVVLMVVVLLAVRRTQSGGGDPRGAMSYNNPTYDATSRSETNAAAPAQGYEEGDEAAYDVIPGTQLGSDGDDDRGFDGAENAYSDTLPQFGYDDVPSANGPGDGSRVAANATYDTINSEGDFEC